MDDDKIHSGEQPYAAGGEPAEEQSKSTISADLIRGHINTIILRTLDERDKYGYEIINEIEAKSHGQYTIKQPTLYSALKRLETQGYIKAYWKTDEVSSGGRRKYFTLTELGREFSEKNQSEWEYSRTVIDSLISDRSFDFSQPAPTPVDFNILKKSVTRVYTGNGKSESESYEESPAADSRTYDALNDATLKDEYSGQSVHDIYVEKVPDKIVAEEKSEHDEYVQPSAAVEALPAEARVHAHYEDQVAVRQYALKGRNRRCRIYGDSRLYAVRLYELKGSVKVNARLLMNDDVFGLVSHKIAHVFIRVFYHKVNVVRCGFISVKGFHHSRPEGNVGNEVSVHNVNVKICRSAFAYLYGIFA